MTGKSKNNAPHWRGSFLSATTGSEACETREATTHARVLRSEQESRTPGRASSSSQLPCRTRTRPLLKIERWFTGAPAENARLRHLGRRRPSGVALARRFACPADENQARTGIVKRAPLYGWSVNLFFLLLFRPSAGVRHCVWIQNPEYSLQISLHPPPRAPLPVGMAWLADLAVSG